MARNPPASAGALRALGYRVVDLTYFKGFRRIVGWLIASAGIAVRPFRRGLSNSLLLWSHRCHLFVQSMDRPTTLQRILEGWFLRSAAPGARPIVTDASDPPSAEELRLLRARTIVLKNPRREAGGIERGVLLVKFTEQFSVLRRSLNLSALVKDYAIVLEPSMSGYADSGVMGFLGTGATPVFVLASEERDFHFLRRLSPHYAPIPLGSGNWVNPDLFHPIPGAERRYDAVMVAGWRLMKRHHALFAAVRRLRDPKFRLALLGDHHDDAPTRAMLAYYGLSAQTFVAKGLRAEAVNEMYATSGVNVLTTRREGSNKSLAEGFFADTPGVALENVIGPDRSYINEETGLLVRERDLAEALRAIQKAEVRFSPRAWAIRHISPLVSTATLNRILRAHALARGEPWTQDIVPKENRPELSYLDPAERARHPDLARVMTEYPRS